MWAKDDGPVTSQLDRWCLEPYDADPAVLGDSAYLITVARVINLKVLVPFGGRRRHPGLSQGHFFVPAACWVLFEILLCAGLIDG